MRYFIGILVTLLSLGSAYANNIGPVEITVGEAISSLDSYLVAGSHVSKDCRLDVERGAGYITVRVSQQQLDGSFDLYHSTAINLDTVRYDILSVTSETTSNKFTLTLKTQWQEDPHGSANPENIQISTMDITSNTITIFNPGKPSYSCKLP